MKKYIISLILILMILAGTGLGAVISRKYIIVNGRVENVFYPEGGFVRTEDEAIELCCDYINNIYFSEGNGLSPEDYLAEYDERIDAWVITDKRPSGVAYLDGLTMAIRKTDGKILMHSMY